MEYEDGKVKVNKYADKPEDVRDYLMMQRRFKHLTDDIIAIITEQRDKELEIIRNWAKA